MSFIVLMNKPRKKKLSLDEALVLFDKELIKRRHKWRLTAIAGWFDWDDVCQVLRIHLSKKFFMYDNVQPFPNWANRIISNQIANLLRNYHSNYISPCQRCVCAEGDNLCSIYGTQGSQCPLFAKWEKSKKQAYNVKLPLYLENHLNEYYDKPQMDFDVERTAPIMHEKMKELLKPLDYRIYKILYIDNKSEEDAARILGYKTTEAGRTAGYKTIKEAKKIIMITARSLLANGEIENF